MRACLRAVLTTFGVCVYVHNPHLNVLYLDGNDERLFFVAVVVVELCVQIVNGRSSGVYY